MQSCCALPEPPHITPFTTSTLDPTTNTSITTPQAPIRYLAHAPLNLPAVEIGFVNPAVGYGLFAARDLAPDEFIFQEGPLITALYNEKFSASDTLTKFQTNACRTAFLTDPASCSVSAVAFPALAAHFGIAPAPFELANQVLAYGLGLYLVPGQGQFAGSTRKPRGKHPSISSAP
ncbi:hypothetical protein N0V88_004365 [Collariella sp. IMI 366227]|nr:hypothetical protein N0V88_004365 [Collariella sp. IMI 366227]